MDTVRPHGSSILTNPELPFHPVILVCATAILCYLATWASFELGAPRYHVDAFWPASPILVAILLLAPRKIWPQVMVAGLAGIAARNFHNGVPSNVAIWLTAGDLLGVLVASLGIRLLSPGDARLTNVRSMARYFLVAVILAPLASAFVGATAIARVDYWLQWKVWFFSDALGFLTVTPAILVWVRDGRAWVRKYQNWLEFVALLTVVVLVGTRLFTDQEQTEAPVYVLIPILLWASLRLGLKGLSAVMIVIAILSMWGTSHGRGPFTESALMDRVLSLQLFLFFTAMPFMFLSVLWEEHIDAQHSLLREQARLDEAQHLAQVGSWWWDQKTDVVTWSKESARMAGHDHRVPPPAFQQHSKFYAPASWDQLTKTVDSTLRTGLPFQLELETVQPDGSTAWVTARGAVVRDFDGRVVGLQGTIQDITERKRAEQNKILHSAIVESSDDAILYVSLDAVILSWNAGAQRIFGYTKEEVIGQLMTILTPPELRGAGIEILGRLRGGEHVLHYETIRVSKDGREIDVSITAAPIRDLDGRVIGVSKIVRDISQSKQIETARRESVERFQLAMQDLSEGLFILDRQGLLTYLNPAAERMFGWKKEELLGKKMGDVMHYTHPDGTPFLAEDYPGLRVLETGIPFLEFQDEFIRSDGRVFPVYFSASPIRENNQIVGAVVVFRDDTQRRQAAQAVREVEERFRLVANTAPVMIWMAGVDKLCTYFNQKWLDFTGRSVDRELGKGWTDGVHPEDFERCLDIYTTAFDQREPFQMEYRLRRRDGEYCWILDSGVPRFEDDGSFAGYIGSAIDVTDRRLAEEAISRVGGRLIQAHEEERSRIARELHDDIGQRLGLLATEIERLGQSMSQLPAEIRSQTHELWQSTAEIASDVQGISHRLHSSKLKYLGIVVAARSFCRELSVKQGVDIDFVDENVPLVVPEDIGLCLYRVLQEALQNAVKYSGVRHFEVSIEGSAGDIHLAVRDAGIGFDADTAKSKQGLGLISMLERVNLVNGTISITSALNLGTEVSVRIPLSTGEQTGKAMSATP